MLVCSILHTSIDTEDFLVLGFYPEDFCGEVFFGGGFGVVGV